VDDYKWSFRERHSGAPPPLTEKKEAEVFPMKKSQN
jgi:hypothetical protein